MKQTLLFAALLGLPTFLQAEEPDSLKSYDLGEAVARSVKAPDSAPFATTNVRRSQLEQFAATAQELPHLLARTPGVVAWSENGVGLGTTSMRLRGSGDSRINVTLDGVPLNSPEDQCVFWANTGSYASLLQSVQVQRGVGTSTHGDGAFGGSVAMQSRQAGEQPALTLTGAGGSYGTWRVGGDVSTGILAKCLTLDASFYTSRTQGYIHGTAGRTGSYYGALTWRNPARTLQLAYKNIGNFEHTGQAWNGVATGPLMEGNLGQTGSGVKGYADLRRMGLGRYNVLCEQLIDPDRPELGTKPYLLADGTPWKQTTDNYWQDHSLLSLAWRVDSAWTLSATAHYTYGFGYYDELKPQCAPQKFGLTGGVEATDFVRQKGLREDMGGLIVHADYASPRFDVIAGAAAQMFGGHHFGHLTYVADAGLAHEVLGGGRYTYYRSAAHKRDISVYAKMLWRATPHLRATLDLQYRDVGYRTDGSNDKFTALPDGRYVAQPLNISKHYPFFNPKAGLTWQAGPHTAYLSFAVSHREPERNNFTDNGSQAPPTPEALYDTELGYSFRAGRWHLSANAYWMHYRNQFVQTGELSDIGERLTSNIPSSRRLGVELSAACTPVRWLTLEANAALSRNRLTDFHEQAEDWDSPTGFTDIHYPHSTLAFSPSFIGNFFADFRFRRWTATWHTAAVSRQYLDNTSCLQRSLPAYTFSDLRLTYAQPWGKSLASLLRRTAGGAPHGRSEALFSLTLSNILNTHYVASGWVYSAICASAGNPNSRRYTEMGFMPSAGFTLLGSVTLKL